MFKQSLRSFLLLSVLFSTVLSLSTRQDRDRDRDRDTRQTGPVKLLGSHFGVPGNAGEYDYVVVGAGCAGAVVATRLAKTGASVALIEAGTFSEISNGNQTQVPATAFNYMGKDATDWQPGIDWGFVTTPQVGAFNERVHYARGKAFGGSTARNIMTYHAPTRGSMQAWADAVGDSSYEFDNIWPYFMKHQGHKAPDYTKRFENTTVWYDADRLGRVGPVSVIYPNYGGAYGTYARQALAEAGIHPRNGMESGGLLGHSYTLMTIDGSENIRDSASTAYIQPALEEDNNLILFPSTLAKRVVFNGTRAVAVDLDTMGRQYSLRARREVIISAGAFQSPQLLMVSGIGPSAKLAHHNIPVISELPGVGENMWDHILFGPSYRVNVITGSKTIQDPVFRAQQIDLFRNQRRGILTAPGGDILGWEHVPQRFVANYTEDIRADLASFPEDWPHIEYLFPGAVFGYAQNLPRDQPRDGYNYASVIGALVAPMSRGTVNIASRNTADPPLINPNWLTHPTDQAVAITAFKRAREIGTTRAMRNITIGQEFFPGLEVQTDAQILDLVSRALLPVSHAACTCRMGRGTDRMAVVDPHARVYGVQGLRVVDASSMPILVPGHPMATIYAYAEKIADDIIRAL